MATVSHLTWLDRFEELSRPVRVLVLVGAHLFLFAGAYICAFLLRFDFQIPPEFQEPFVLTLFVALGLKVLIFGAMKMFQGWWKYVSLYDVIALALALAIASLALFLVNTLVIQPVLFPRSIYLLDFTFSLLFLGGARGALRLFREAFNTGTGGTQRRLLIVGAGDVGDLLVREISRANRLNFQPVAFLDNAAHKKGLRLHGIPVKGPLSRLPEVVEELDIEEVIIALDPAHQGDLRTVVDLCMDAGVTPRILPAVETVLDGEISLRAIREVSISDLLRRDPVELDEAQLADFLRNRTVMITGAGGSIGSELCRQVLRLEPARLILVESAETPLFSIHRELADRAGDRLVALVADVTQKNRMEQIFSRYAPEVILHAAAYKHVPLMEENPAEAVRNNIHGTRVVADLAGQHRAKAFVLISTDKAVNPTSVMGATKRITELYVHSVRPHYLDTRFCAVRFGNVLGSNGSVVPIFRDQIRRGGPVTVTHPDMTRYFMTIPEAVQLVLQAAAFDSEHSLFILDMGEPVKISDLARDMIRLSGLTEEEIPIVYSGIRPGEKLFEELSLDGEELQKTAHAKIFIGKVPERLPEHFETLFRALIDAGLSQDELRVRFLLSQLIPGYRSNFSRRGERRDRDLRAAP